VKNVFLTLLSQYGLGLRLVCHHNESSCHSPAMSISNQQIDAQRLNIWTNRDRRAWEVNLEAHQTTKTQKLRVNTNQRSHAWSEQSEIK
jgi:hypothetical protein